MPNKEYFYTDLKTSEMIFIELLKRFPRMKPRKGAVIADVFGKGWDKLDEVRKNKAKDKFLKEIGKGTIRGIDYDHDTRTYSLPKKMNSDEIYNEILKKFPIISQGIKTSLLDIFGTDWALLDDGSKRIAEEKFIDGIRTRKIKGIIYDLDKKSKELKEKYDGVILYTRINTDNYK